MLFYIFIEGPALVAPICRKGAHWPTAFGALPVLGEGRGRLLAKGL